MILDDITHEMSGIYQIIFDNGKSYIGLTNDLRRRMIEHLGKDIREHPELVLSKAILKHSIVNIKLLEEIDGNDREKLKEREKYWIAYFDTYNNGYNMTEGGDGLKSGIYNPSASLNKEQLDKVIYLLQNSNLTYEEIIDKLGITITRNVIVKVNNGTHYKDSSLKYPIREKRVEHYGINNKTSKFYNDSDSLQKIIEAIQNPKLSFSEISKMYNISTSLLCNINNGTKYYQDNLSYPLRQKNANQKRYFTNDEMLFIKNNLENKTMTMSKLAEVLHCDRKVISQINQGIRQRQDNWEYPLKK